MGINEEIKIFFYLFQVSCLELLVDGMHCQVITLKFQYQCYVNILKNVNIKLFMLLARSLISMFDFLYKIKWLIFTL
jgi:hypothetical protein